MRMITTAPRVLAAAASAVAVFAVSAPALGAECRDEPKPAECKSTAKRRSASGILNEARLPATIADDTDWLDPAFAIDFDESEIAKALSAPGVQVAWPSSLPAAKPPGDTPVIGMWSKLDMERAGESARTRSGVGLSYKPSRSATIGMTVEGEESRADAALTEQTKMAAVLGLKPSPIFSFEASAAWAHQNAGDAANLSAQSTQNELSARISGDWQLGAFKLAPSVSVAQSSELGATETAGATKGSIVVAPKISRPVALDHAQTLEPFLTFRQEFDFSAQASHAGPASKAETRSAGAGIKLDGRDAYSLSVTTGVENLEADRHSLRSEFRLSVPLK